MNTRHSEIGHFFTFLQENVKKSKKFESIFDRVELEITEEQKINPNVDNNEYLNSLLQIHTITLPLFEKSKSYKPEKITKEDFRNFMQNLMQDVSLHGLGAVEWEDD